MLRLTNISKIQIQKNLVDLVVSRLKTALGLVGTDFNFTKAMLRIMPMPLYTVKKNCTSGLTTLKKFLVQQGLAGNQEDLDAATQKFEIESSF